MYEIDDTLAETGAIRRYEKKHRRECASCFANLLTVRDGLNMGMSIQQMMRCSRFLRSEGEDVYRIGQTGVVGAKESRLYVYVRIANERIYTLLVGDKDSQRRDVNTCHQIVRNFKKTAQAGRKDRLS